MYMKLWTLVVAYKSDKALKSGRRLLTVLGTILCNLLFKIGYKCQAIQAPEVSASLLLLTTTTLLFMLYSSS